MSTMDDGSLLLTPENKARGCAAKLSFDTGRYGYLSRNLSSLILL